METTILNVPMEKKHHRYIRKPQPYVNTHMHIDGYVK